VRKSVTCSSWHWSFIVKVSNRSPRFVIQIPRRSVWVTHGLCSFFLLDNATLARRRDQPVLSVQQIKSHLLGLIIAVWGCSFQAISNIIAARKDGDHEQGMGTKRSPASSCSDGVPSLVFSFIPYFVLSDRQTVRSFRHR